MHKKTLPALHVGASTRLGSLDLFPIWTDAKIPRPRRYTLPDPLSKGLVSEVKDHPSICELFIDNQGAHSLLLLEGIMFDAGMQHRVLTSSILATAHCRTRVPVRCVEVSRWSGTTDQRFCVVQVPLLVRRELRSGTVDQGRVWERVAQYERRHGKRETHSLVEILDEAAQDSRDALGAVRALPAQRGVIVAALGHPVLLDVVDHPASLTARWEGLIGGLAAETAQLPYVATPAWRARAFVHRVGSTHIHEMPGAGAGISCEADEGMVSLRGIRDDSALLHACGINTRHELTLEA